MNSLRIAINAMLLREPLTGVEHSILNLARALETWGSLSYDVYVPARFGTALHDGERVRWLRSGVPLRSKGLRILWEQLVLPGRARASGVDCLHAPGYVSPLRATCPVVLTIYDIVALLHPEWCTRANHAHYRLMLPRSARSATSIVVPSETTRRDLCTRLNIDSSRVHTVPLAVGDAFQADCPDEERNRIRRELGLPSRFILFLGQLEPKKNLPRLIDAFRILKSGTQLPHKLVIAGTEGWRCADLRHKIRACGIQEQIVMPGYIPDDKLPALYRAADLFVFPSLYEGFGLPPLEAMACGTPVVASDAASLPEVLGDAALLVNPLKPAALAEAMGRALSDQALRAGLIERGSKRAAMFTWKAHAEATDAVYREACAPRASAQDT